MAKLDPGRLIDQAQHLVDERRALCDRSRRAITESKRLQDRLTLLCLDRARRKRLLAK